MMKKFTYGFLACLFAVVSTATFAQQQSYTSTQVTNASNIGNPGRTANTSGDVSADLKAAVTATLRQSTNYIWFEKNAGQFNNPDVLYGFRTTFGSMGVYNNKLRIVTNQKEFDEEDEKEETLPLQIVDITFPGSNPTWTVEAGSKSSVIGSYYTGTNKKEKGISPAIYNEVTLKNVYPGIDLRLYSGAGGSLEFDWLVSRAADYGKIKMQMTGQDGLLVENEGNLTIKMHENSMKMVIPETFQTINGAKKTYKTSVVKLSDNTVAYHVSGDYDMTQPMVIDPVMNWSTYMHNGSSSFDEYLYSIASNTAGEVYCAGFTNEALSVTYLSGVSAGYSNAFSANPSTVLYKLNAAGTSVLAWTMTGVTGAANFPSDLDIFPDGRILLVYTEDVVQIFTAALDARSYSGSINTAGNGNHAQYQSVVAIDNATFYVSGTATSAYPTSIVPANAPDPTFAGSSEGVIIRVTGANTGSLTAAWGTYVGGSNNETFASIASSIDKSKIAFAVHTVVGSGYPALVNAVDNTIAGTTEILVGVIPVSATPVTAFSVFSYLGGSSSEGLSNYSAISGGPQGADKAVVCADNNYFYVGYNTSSTDIPGTTGAVQTTNKGAQDQAIARIPFNGSAGTGFIETYNGGSSDDIVGGIAVDFRSSNVILFGTTTSTNYPVNNTTPASPYYQNSFGGIIDIGYASFSNGLDVRTYGTYLGGTEKDYMGSTGILRGSGHLYYNNTNGLVYIGTTIHSDQSTVPAQWITNVPGFDKSIPAQTASKDNHFIFNWNSNTFDYGDAPASYDGSNAARSAITDKIRLGLTIDAETAPLSTSTANGDDLNNSGATDDEDGVAVIPMTTTGATSYSVSVSVFNNTGLPITLRGWIDANNNGTFDATETSVLTIPTSTSQQTVTLAFTGLPAMVYGSGNTFLRVRLSDGTLSATNAQGEVQAGEVEDYQVCIKPSAGPDQTVCLIGTATMAASGAGTWTAQSGNPGTAVITTPTSPTTTIKTFSAVGTYHFIYTNTAGCTDTADVIVTTQPGAVTITPATANICVGSSINLTASSSPAGGVYQWSPLTNITPTNGTGATVTVNPTGTLTYSVVYSIGGCQASSNRVVTVYPGVTADAGPNQTYCSNVSTTISLGGSPTATGGSGNLTYAWSPPTRLSATNVANPTITSIVASNITYYVTVTDNTTGCSSIDSVKLTINPAVTVSIALSDTDLCLGQSATLAATGTPSGGSYTWTPTLGMTPSAGNTASVSVAPSAAQTTYTVVYSLAGCTQSAARKVNVYPNLTASAGPDQTYCLPVGSTITIGGSPTVTGGSGSFTYAWSPSTRLSATNVANPTITSAVASTTTYIVTVTDTKSGCASVDSMVLTINSQATVSITSPDTNLCAGQAATLTASGAPTGGTYLWSPLTNITPGAGNTATVSVSPPVGSQTYNVTYTTTGCSGTASKTVNVVSAVVASAGGNQTYCNPVATTITLGGSPTGSGGSNSYSYAWSPSTRLSATNVARPTITSAVASTIKYFVTVTDNVSGCSSVDSMILTINPAVTANAGTATATCLGSGIQIGGSPTTGGGGTGTLSYAWSPTTGLSASNVSNPTATPLTNTTYSVTVTDTKSCSATSSILVSVNPVPTANAGGNQTLTACSAASVSIGGTPATGSGGTGTLTYNWSPAGGLDATNISNPTVSKIGSTTTYTVTVTDTKGCTATASVRVDVTSSTLQVDAGVNANYCAGTGTSKVFTGTVTGGAAPYVYAWSPATGLSSTTTVSTSANPSIAGSYLYTLNVTDTNGCSASDTVRLDVWPSITVDAGPTTAVCAGASATIGGSPATASNGTAPFVYLWSPGGTLSSTSISNPVATPTGNTTYTVTVTDAHSCSATGSTLVNVNANPIADAGTDQTFCLPVTSAVKLGATTVASGGTSGTYTYLWSPATNLSSTTAANPTVTISGATSLEYHLTVRDAVTLCSATDSTHLTILAHPTVTIASADTDLCTSQSALLIATGTPTGGTYQWQPLVNIVPGAGNTDSVTVSPTANQTYQVIYVQNTCSDTAYKTVRVYTTLQASAGPDQQYCLPVGSTITIGGNPTASLGSGSYSYSWSPAINLSSTTVANPTITAATAGTVVYTVTVTDNITGCNSTSSMTLIVNPTATVTIPPVDTNLCAGQSTTLTAVGIPSGGTYQWSPTFNMNPGLGNTASVIVAPSGTQTYQVTYTVNGCSGSTFVTVNVVTPVVAHAGIDQSFCLPYAPTIFLGPSSTATGGSGSYSYHWSPSANLNDSTSPNPSVAKVNTNTEYYLTVTDNVSGCTSVDSTHLSIDTHATLSIAATDTDLCFGQNTLLTGVANPTGGTYQWVPVVYLNPGTGNTQSVSVMPITTQVYQLVYTRNGCRDTAYKTVNVYPNVVAHAGGDQTYCLPVSATVTLGATNTATGGSNSYTYLWSPATHLSSTTVSNPTIDTLVASSTKYFVTVTDAVTGCTAVDSMVLTVSPKVTVTITSPQTDICASESAVLTASGIPAGGNYQWNPIVAMTPANGNAATVSVAPASGSQTYFVYYELNGCKDTSSIAVRTYPQPVVDAGPDQSFCLPVTTTVRVGNVATGGSGNFTYHWTPAANVNDSTAARPRVDSIFTPGVTVYTVKVTDNVTGCTTQDSVVITLSAKPHVAITSPDTNLCTGQTTILTASSTTTGGTFQWSPLGTLTPPAGNTAAVTVAPIGTTTYQVVYGSLTTFITNDGDSIQVLTGCYDTAYQTVHVYTAPIADAGNDQTFCLPYSGVIKLGATQAATGGSGQFKYSWTPSTNLSDSTLANPIVTASVGSTEYYLTVTDTVSGCTSIDSTHLTINSQVSVSVASADTNLCTGQSAILTATGLPSGGTYQWSPLGNLTPSAGNTATVTVTPPIGIQHYQVVYNRFGCTDTAYKTVTVYTAPVANAGGNQTYCFPVTDTVRLGATPAATGGSGHYLYSWSPAINLSSTTVAHPIVTDTAVTSIEYHLTVTDSVSGCTSVDSMRLIINPTSSVSISSADTDLCQGQNTTLTAVGAPPGGTYQWTPLGSITPSAGNTASISVAPPVGNTTYRVTYTLSNCSATATKTVRVFTSPVANAGPDKSFCPPTTSVQIGQTATGGSGSYTYLWASNPAGFISTSATPTVTPTAATTTYYVTVTDAVSGCTSVDSTVVIKHTAPPVDAGQDKGICIGSTTQLVASGALTYQWSPLTNMSPTAGNSQIENVSPTVTTTYTVTGTDQYGCTASDSVTVTISPNLIVTIPPVTLCEKDSARLVPNLTGPNYRYIWSPGIGISCQTCAIPVVSPPAGNNVYNVTITDTITGCTGTDSVKVTVHSLPNASFQAFKVCVGDTVQFTDRSTSTDPIASWYYNFGDTTTLADTSHAQNPKYVYHSFAVHDAYEIVTTIYGCSDSVHNNVESFPPVVANAGRDTTIAYGTTIVLSATGGVTFHWSPAAGLSDSLAASPSAHPLTTTTYVVTVTSADGCTGIDSVTVTVVPLPDVHAGPDTAVCVGSAVVLQGFSKTPNVTYSWSPITYLDSPNVAQPTAVPQVPGVFQYVLTVTEFSNGVYVSAYDTMYLTANPVPQITATPDSVSVCSGIPYHVNFNSSLASTTYTWTGSNGTSGAGNIPTTTIVNNGITDSLIYYTVIGQVPGGCTDTIVVPVVIKAIPVLTATPFPAEICSGFAYTGTVTSSVPAAVITWTSTLGPNGTGGNINQVFNNPGNTPLTVVVTYSANYGGCTSVPLLDTFVVNPLPHADAGADHTTVSCSSDSIQIGGSPTGSLGTPGYTYSWSPTAGLVSTTISNPYVKHLGANTIFTVTVTDSKGCTASDDVSVTVTPPTLAITLSKSGDTTWCAGSGQSVDFTVNVTGGTATYTYVWTPSAFLSDSSSQVVTASPQAAGSYPYTVVVTDAGGCQASKTKTVVVKPLPRPAITGLNGHYCASSPQVPLTATIAGGTWSGSGVVNTGSGYVFRPSQVGPGSYLITYTVTQTGCTHDTSQVVIVDSLPVTTIAGNNPSYCTFDPLTTFVGSPAGGTWSGPGINPVTGVFNPATVSVPNNVSRVITIRYRVSGASGCSDSTSVNITINKSPSVTITVSADSICQGGAVTLTPHYASLPLVNNIQWFDVNGTSITNSLNPVVVHPTRVDHGYYAVISSLQGCVSNDTISIHVNQSPVANDDYDSTCVNSPLTIDVRANDTDPENNVSNVRVLSVKYGTATVVAGNVVYTPVYGYHGLDTLTYQTCNVGCSSDCDTAQAFLYICPQNLPPTADTITYTAFQNQPHDINVLLAVSDPNGDPLTISLVGTHDSTLTVVKTGNGAYTVTGTTVGTYPIEYQVCDTDQYPIHVLCDTAVIYANIITPNNLVNHPPVANDDYATTTGIQPATVNVRGNDFDPDGNPLSNPSLSSNSVTGHGHFSVNTDGTVTFQPNSGLAQGVYYDTVRYCIFDITTIAPQPLSSCAVLIVTTNVIDVPGNRPPLAVDDHLTVAQGTPATVNVKGNDSDPDGDALGTPTVLTPTTSGTVTSVNSNGTVTYVPNSGVHSINGQPVDSFLYSVCDTLPAHGTALCDTAEVYVYVTPQNLPPTADTIRYTQLVGTPHDVNVILAVSDPNGDPLTITLTNVPTGITYVQTGNGAYTFTGTTPGTYTITYQVCDTDQYPVHVLCASSVIVATIISDTTTPQPPVANNDYATTTGTTPATVNARGNDSDPQGNPLTTPVLLTSTTTGDGSWTVDGSGNVVFTPTPGLAPGIYYDSVQYRVCDVVHPSLCATAWVIVTTNEIDTPVSNRPPLAVDDHLTVAENAVGAVVNVKTNDSDPDGDALGTPSIITGTVNGTITGVSTNGNVTYTPTPYLHSINGQPVDSFKYVICDTLSAHGPAPLCDTAEAYINVAAYNLPPVANDIYLNTPENTPIGVNVASGAYDPNGDPLTYSYPNGSSSTQGGTIVITGNGSVNYTPPTGFIGVDHFTYAVCDQSPYPVSPLCDTAIVFINVTNPADTLVNHPPVASDDHVVTAPGTAIVINVVANDSDPDGNPINVAQLTPSTTTSLGGTISIGANNTVNYTAPSVVADSIVVDTFSYVLCDTNALHAVHKLCDTAFVYITINKFDTNIIHINRPPVAADDYSKICEEEYSIVNVLNNDIDPNGDPLTVRSIITAPTHGIAAVSSPSVVYIPALYFFGQDSLQYQVCDNRTPSLCDTAWVHYTVNLINHRPLAVQDTTSTSMQTAVNIPVTVNDNEPDGDSTTLAIVTPPVHGTAVQVGNTYIYTPATGYAGDDTFYYRVCDVMNPTAVYCSAYTQQCDVGLVSIHILHHPPHIPPTYDTIPQNTPPVTICPAVSDSDGNSVKVTSFPCGPYHGTVGFASSDSCLVYTPTHDFTGDDTICVVVCDNVTPALCDTNQVYIHVTPTCIPPVAVVDSYTVFHLATSATLNVTANDTNHTTSALVVSVVTQPTLGIATVSGGTIRYVPNGTTGADQFTYAICSVNPACTTCDTGIVYVNVTGAPSTPPVAVNDSARIPQDSSVCVRVIANDRPGSNPIHLTSACTPSHGTNSIAANGYICYVPTHGFFGTDSFCYTICDNNAPALCSTATVIVTVTPNPHPPVAVNDHATTPQATAVTVNVPANDSDPDGNLNIGSVTVVTLPTNGAVTNINPTTGVVTYVPDSTYLGVDSFRYSICDSTPVSFGGPLCATATVYINVTPLNHPPHAPNDTVTIPQDSTVTVCPAVSDPDAGQTLAITSTCTPGHGTVIIAGPTCVTYVPSPSFYGTDSFCYVVCDNGSPSLCDTGVVTVVVTHVPQCPVTVKDFYNATDTVPVVLTELSNDLYVGTIGAGYSVTIVSGPAAGNTAVLNANGTITYTAAAGYTGNDVITYKATDSLDNCSSTAAITIFVVDTCVGPIAANDLDTICEGAILSADVRANDYLGNAGPTTLTVTGTGNHGFAYLNTTTGHIDYVAANYFHGLDTVTYQVCNNCVSGPRCSTGQLVVNVLVTNHAPVAVDDTATMIEDHSDTINVVANDTDVDGDALTVSISAQPANGTLKVYNNQLIYTPNPNYCGTDTFGYQITGGTGSPLCPGQRAWDLGLVFVNITCVNDTPVIPDTLVHVPEDSIITICVPYTDPDVGDHHTATVLCTPLHGTFTSAPAASDTPALVCMTYKPDTNYYGVDSVCIILCDNGTPALCDTSHITIIVDPRNEPPVVQDQHVSTPKGQPIGVNISSGAFDPNGDPITYIYPAGSGPHNGTWTPDTHTNGTGVYTPTNPLCPPVGGTCSDSFTVVVCDNSPYFVHVLCDTATVYVTIYDTTGVPNHAPVANTDNAVTDTIHSVLVYVEANDLDPDGDALTVPTIITPPTHGSVGLNGNNIPVYTPSGTFTSTLTVDSFAYSVCDTNAVHLPRPLCDTAWAYIVIDNSDSATIHHNQAPVAVDDYAQTQYGQTVVIPVLHNDSDPNGDPIHVTTVITVPADSAPHRGTTTVNADGTITYIPDTGPGRGPNANHPDTFYYVICDTSAYVPASLCDTARVIVSVPNSVQAVNDTTLTGSSVPVVIHVKNNDYDPELDSFYVVGAVTGPQHGTATLDSLTGTFTYTPDSTACTLPSGALVDSFSYAIRDTLGAMDTAWVYVHVKCCSVIANDDTFKLYQGDTLHAAILLNDGLDPTVPHHITFSRLPLHGTLTVIAGDTVIYVPDTAFCGKDYFEYVVSDTCGRDTGNVVISITCANRNAPVAINDTISLCRNTDSLIAVLANDYDIDGDSIFVSAYTAAVTGTVSQQGNKLFYHPVYNYEGPDSFTYRVCDNGVPSLCSTATVYLDIHRCPPPPITVDTLIRDTTTACTQKTFCIDSIYEGVGYTVHFAGFCDSADHGTVVLSSDTTTGNYGTLCFTYTPNCDTTGGFAPYTGNDTMCLIICSIGLDTACTTTHVIITILPKPPVDSIWANNDVAYTCVTADTIAVLANDGFVPNPGNSQTGTAIHVVTAGANAGLAPHLGTIVVSGDLVIYTPDPSEQGTDTFRYVIADNGTPQQFDTATVYVYVCTIPTPIAVDDNQSCMDTTTLVNTPGVINVLANDTLFPAQDTTVAVVTNPGHGKVTVNANLTVTFLPDTGFHGNDNFEYSVCETVGSLTTCDTASVCINVVDTVTPCFFPTGFSPNGDGVNDKFSFPCNDNFPNATIKIFNRWGDEVYESAGAYKNDWSGTNLQGANLPDGTYYFIYQYNDGSGKSAARFVVLHR